MNQKLNDKIDTIQIQIDALQQDKIDLVNEDMLRICAEKRLMSWQSNRKAYIQRNRRYLS